MTPPLVDGLVARSTSLVEPLANRAPSGDAYHKAWADLTGVELWRHLLVGNSLKDHGYAGATFAAADGATVGGAVTGLEPHVLTAGGAFGFTDGSNSAVVAADLATGQPTAGLDTLDFALVRVASNPAGTRDIFGNRDFALPNNGREIQLTATGTLLGAYDTAGGTRFIAHPGAHSADAWVAIVMLDRQSDATPDIWIASNVTGASNEGTTSGLATALAEHWSLGKNRGLSIGGQILLWGQTVGVMTSWGATEIDGLITTVTGALVT